MTGTKKDCLNICFKDNAKVSKIFNKLKTIISTNQNIILGVSGGMDSMLMSVLLLQFYQMNNLDINNITIVHCNHKTRPETEQEEAFVKDFFSNQNLEIVSNDSPDLKTESELRARRYSEINKISNNTNSSIVFLGHNLTDRIESTFLNMLRGCDLNGFISMKYKSNHHLLDDKEICRPLLDISKPEIETICKKNNIPYIQDSSNFSSDTSLRNKVRLDILNPLYSLSNNQSIESNSFINSMNNIYEQLNAIEESNLELTKIYEIRERNSRGARQLKKPSKKLTKQDLQEVLKKIGIYKNITKGLLEEFISFFNRAESGYKYFNNSCFFVFDNKIYIIRAEDKFWMKSNTNDNKITKIGTYKIGKKDIQITDQSLVGLSITYPVAGMKYGSKSRGKYCINKKIPIFYRNFIPIIAENKQIKKHFYHEIINNGDNN